MDAPLVTVVTSTWQRHQVLLERCIPSVEGQTYPNIEHIVVSDGPDPELRAKIGRGVRFVELGRNMMQYASHWGATPRMVAAYLAQGEYIAYLDDDDEWLPDHVAGLVDLIEGTDAGFAFSQMLMLPEQIVIGTGAVVEARIGTSMILHKADLLWTVANWRAAGYASDLDLASRWAQAGVHSVFRQVASAIHH